MKDTIQWNYSIPFFSWFILRIFFFLYIIPILFVLFLLFISGNLNNFNSLTPDIYYAFCFFSAIIFLTLIITFIIFHDGFATTYIVNNKGIYQISGQKEKKIHRLSIIAGLLGRSAGTAGAGLLAYGGEERFIAWSDAKIINIKNKKKYVYISRGRFSIGPIGMFCTTKNFNQIVSIIKKKSA